MSRTFAIAALLLAACGGKERSEVDGDTDFPDAPYYDLDGRWGECCFTYEGGVVGVCPDGGERRQCSPTQYCGLEYPEFNATGTPAFSCCGYRFPDAGLTENEQIDRECPPFPAIGGSPANLPDAGVALAPHWGECCYVAHGGVPGICEGQDNLEQCPNDAGFCEQCAPYQYCGYAIPNTAATAPSPMYSCCGDRYLAAAGYSPIDPSCMPASWDGGS